MDFASHVISGALCQWENTEPDLVASCATLVPCFLPRKPKIDASLLSKDPRMQWGFAHYRAINDLVHASPQFHTWEEVVRHHVRDLPLGKHPSNWAYHVLTEQIIGGRALEHPAWKKLFHAALQHREAVIALLHIPDALRMEKMDIAHILNRVFDVLDRNYLHYHQMPRFAQRSFSRLARTHSRQMGEDAQRIDHRDWQLQLHDAIARVLEHIPACEVQQWIARLTAEVRKAMRQTCAPDSATLGIHP